MEWPERIEKLKAGLRMELGRVLSECVGCELGVTVEEVMVRAVGEIIRLIEQKEAGKWRHEDMVPTERSSLLICTIYND